MRDPEFVHDVITLSAFCALTLAGVAVVFYSLLGIIYLYDAVAGL